MLSVVGTRPEAIKMAPVVRALAAPDSGVEGLLLVTGQHRQMLDQALVDLELSPHLDLDLMRPDQTAAQVLARVVAGVAEAIGEARPDMVLVHGDTGTAAGAAQAAFLTRVPLGHVEAGLRSGSLAQPFPEEGNRRVVDTLAQVLWAPTPGAAAHLEREGLRDRRILVTGNTVIDALHQALPKARRTPIPGFAVPDGAPVVLVTAHRRESFGAPFEDLCRGLRRVADENPAAHVVYPVHLNPNVREPVIAILGGHPRIHLLEPMGYLAFVRLMERATLVITDSGGIQEEAPALGKPVLVMRERTERPEAVAAGTVRLVGTRAATIAREARRLLTDPAAYRAMARAVNPYGDGRAAARIAASVRAELGLGRRPRPFVPASRPRRA